MPSRPVAGGGAPRLVHEALVLDVGHLEAIHVHVRHLHIVDWLLVGGSLRVPHLQDTAGNQDGRLVEEPCHLMHLVAIVLWVKGTEEACGFAPVPLAQGGHAPFR